MVRVKLFIADCMYRTHTLTPIQWNHSKLFSQKYFKRKTLLPPRHMSALNIQISCRWRGDGKKPEPRKACDRSVQEPCGGGGVLYQAGIFSLNPCVCIKAGRTSWNSSHLIAQLNVKTLQTLTEDHLSLGVNLWSNAARQKWNLGLNRIFSQLRSSLMLVCCL